MALTGSYARWLKVLVMGMSSRAMVQNFLFSLSFLVPTALHKMFNPFTDDPIKAYTLSY